MWADNTALIGTLTVYKTDSTSSENMKILWSRSGRQNQNKSSWTQVFINLPISISGSRILFKSQRYFSYMGDIGILMHIIFLNFICIISLLSS
jgi:hypothetical protein